MKRKIAEGKTSSGAGASRATSRRSASGKRSIPANSAATSARKKEAVVEAEQFKRVSPRTAAQIMQRLCAHYPDAECELDFENTFQLLIAVILSAQTTDASVNKATPHLFKRFPNALALAEADAEEVKQIIRPTGYYNAKANNIQSCARALVERFGGTVPGNIEQLVTLPGVGRKTANVVLGVAFGKRGWTVDTHVQRLSGRLGFSNAGDPARIEMELQTIFPDDDWSKFSITLIWHGRRICFARKPACQVCPVSALCPSSLV